MHRSKTNPPALTAHESVYQALRTEIAEGRLAPGARLVQRKLARRMGTSTIPVIDALRRLEGEGLLITTPGIGTRVKKWEPQEAEEVYLIRAALEGVACRLFATRATPGDRERLQERCREFEEAVRAGSLDGSATADERLHFHITQSARSAELVRLVQNSACILLTLSRTMLPDELQSTLPLGPPGVHNRLLAALLSGDPEAAEREGRVHVIEPLDRLRGWFRSHPSA